MTLFDPAVFGALLWAGNDEGLVPLLGLQDGPAASPVSGHLNRLGAHLFFGTALGLGVWALDRVLLSRWYMVPMYHGSTFRLATWDRFGRPEAKVRGGFVLDSWWVDPERAARTDAARRAGN